MVKTKKTIVFVSIIILSSFFLLHKPSLEDKHETSTGMDGPLVDLRTLTHFQRL